MADLKIKRAIKKAWNKANADKVIEYNKAYYKLNKERINVACKIYYATNKNLYGCGKRITIKTINKN